MTTTLRTSPLPPLPCFLSPSLSLACLPASLLPFLSHTLSLSLSSPRALSLGLLTTPMSQWMAPEVLANFFGRETYYDKRCDVFSFGILLWEVCVGIFES